MPPPQVVTRLVQIIHEEFGRRVALVAASDDGDELHLLSTYRTAYHFVQAALDAGHELRDALSSDLSGIVLPYEDVYALRTGWSFLPSFDHPAEVTGCLVSGVANAHTSRDGRPPVPPFFVKGNGQHLRAHGEALTIPAYALSGADEAEIVGVYMIGRDGSPHRVGLTQGNEFADPALFAADSRLYANSKLHTCSIGPELVLEASFEDIAGVVRVERGDDVLWSKEIVTGERHTQFSLSELEASLFQPEAHRVPGQCHVHYLGGSVSSYGDGVRLENGDVVSVSFDGLGRPLRNGIERR